MVNLIIFLIFFFGFAYCSKVTIREDLKRGSPDFPTDVPFPLFMSLCIYSISAILAAGATWVINLAFL